MKEIRITLPITENQVRTLELGDFVYLNGTILTFRDRAFEQLIDHKKKGINFPVNLHGAVHWHCGPITKKINDGFIVASAGPTTSTRFENVEPIAIKEWGVRLVVGKGGLGKPTIDSMREYGAAYLASIGGAGSYYAKKIIKVKEVHWLELGMPEAIWVFEVEHFGPLLVAIDSKGNSLFENMKNKIEENLLKVYEQLSIDPNHSYYDIGLFEYPNETTGLSQQSLIEEM